MYQDQQNDCRKDALEEGCEAHELSLEEDERTEAEH